MTVMTPDDQILASASALPAPSEAPAAPQPYGQVGLGLLQRASDLAGRINPIQGATDFATRNAPQVWHDMQSPGFGERLEANVEAGVTRALEVDNFSADDQTLARQYEPIVEAINRHRGVFDQIHNPYGSPGLDAALGWATTPFSDFSARLWGMPTRSDREAAVWTALDQLRTTNPGAAGNLPKNKAELLADAQQEQRTALAWSNLLSSTGDRTSSAVGQFVGGAAGGFADPPNILLSAVGSPAAKTLLGTFLTEGTLNAALDLAGMPQRSARYQRLGQPMTTAQEAEDVAGAFALGGAVPTGFKALGRALGLSDHALVSEFDHAVPDPGPLARTARTIVDDEAARANQNPFSGDAPGEDLHRQSLVSAAAALDAQRPELVPAREALADRGASIPVDNAARRAGFTVESFHPNDFTFAPSDMQFKRGADERGVTDRLQGVQQWDPTKAGLMLAYEYRDGRLVPADGHQRVGLAQSLVADQPDIRLNGFRLREADGITPRQARVIAALKNIAEGTGEGIDAAAVLREAPDRAAELPPRSPLVRRAKDLAGLGDDAWGMAWNGLVSERDAAIVGRNVRDPRMQSAILGHLARESPDTAEEAELFVRQALAAGASHEVQGDMFGEFLKSNLVLPERARILASTLKSLRRDKALFKTLTDRETEITRAGNVLDTAENARRGDTANRAFGVLKALAERKGPISDALQAAAEKSLKGNRAGAVREFLADVRARVADGRLDGERDGGDLGPLEPEAEAAPSAREREEPAGHGLELFGDPVAKPEAFRQQTVDLARELVPHEAVAETAKSATQGAVEQGAQSEFGPAQPEIDALRAIPKETEFPDPHGEGTTTVGAALKEIEREARAVERLRGCIEGEG